MCVNERDICVTGTIFVLLESIKYRTEPPSFPFTQCVSDIEHFPCLFEISSSIHGGTSKTLFLIGPSSGGL